MSYTDEETVRLKAMLEEILHEKNLFTIHEMKKKLLLADSKKRDLELRLNDVEEDIKKLGECHRCKQHMISFKDAQTQTTEVIEIDLEDDKSKTEEPK